MSTHDEDRLSRILHDRAGDVHGAPVDLADVQRSARGIRRRRRVAGGVAALLVAAVAVPVALSVDDSPGPDRTAAPASPSPSPSVPQAEGVIPLTVDGAPAGAPAAVTYLRGSTVVVPGAEPVDLRAAYATVAPYQGGWLAVQRKQGTAYVVHIDASGRVTSSKPGGDRIVTSQDGVEVSWVEDGRLYLDTTNGHSDQPQSVDLPPDATGYPVGFVAVGSVAVEVDRASGRQVYVTDLADGLRPVPGVQVARATDQGHGVIGGQSSYDDRTGTSCWTLRTNAGGDREPKTCDWTTETISTDGTHVAGYPSDVDGLGSSTVGLLDADLSSVVTFDRQGDADTFVSDVVWEDGSHALASLHQGDRWYLVRLGLDGSLEKVDDASGSPEEPPFRFAAHS